MTFSAGISDAENNRCPNVNTRSPDPRNFWCITSRSGTRMKMKSILLVCLLAILSGGCSLDPGPLRTPEKPFHGDGCSCFPTWTTVIAAWITIGPTGGAAPPLNAGRPIRHCDDALLKKIVPCSPMWCTGASASAATAGCPPHGVGDSAIAGPMATIDHKPGASVYSVSVRP
jgi:hypothetical protein